MFNLVLVAFALIANTASAKEIETTLSLDLSQRQLVVSEGGVIKKKYPVAVGRSGWETPTGQFKIQQKVKNPAWVNFYSGSLVKSGKNNPLGTRWIGFHTDCNKIKTCAQVGFHGTPNRDSIGKAETHGCVRMYDEHVQELFEMVKVGTVVQVLP